MEELPAIIAKIAANDPTASDDVDRLADRLRALAERLRSGEPVAQGIIQPSGMKDRVKMAVIGPDGVVRQETDTGE